MIIVKITRTNTCDILKVTFSGGRNQVLYKEKMEQDTVAQIDYFFAQYINTINKPYIVIAVLERFVFTQKFLSATLALIKESKAQWPQKTIMVSPKIPTKIMAYKILEKYIPGLQHFESEKKAMKYVSEKI